MRRSPIPVPVVTAITLVAVAFFLLAGLGLTGYPFYRLLLGERQGFRDWALPINAGLLFLSFGAAILALNLRDIRKRRERDDLDVELPGQPWKPRAARKTDVVPTNCTAFPWLFGFITWVWNLFSAFFVQIALITPKIETGAWVVLAIWALAGLLMIPVLAHGILVAWKFGRAEFHPDFPAGRVGGVLSGRILTRSDLRRAAFLRLRLQCVALVPHPVAVGDGITHAEKVIWHAESATEGLCLPWDSTGSVIPVRFDIPARCLPTGAVNGHRPVIWRLTVDGDLPGVDYLASFTVPIAAGQGGQVLPCHFRSP